MSPFTFYIRTGLGTFLAKNKFKMPTLRLTRITNCINFNDHHNAYTFTDDRKRYTEKLREKYALIEYIYNQKFVRFVRAIELSF